MKVVGAIEKTSPRLKETGLETNHPISFLKGYKTSTDPGMDRILGAVWWGNRAAGPFLRDATQKEHKILRLRLVWLADHIQVGRSDRSAGPWHCSQKENGLGQEHCPALAPGRWSRRAVAGARSAEQQCQGALGTGQAGEHPSTGQTKQPQNVHSTRMGAHALTIFLPGTHSLSLNTTRTKKNMEQEAACAIFVHSVAPEWC